jgi:hypothetical protein
LLRVRFSPATEAERLKYQVADELGLIDRLLEVGWGGLTAEETGKIGGIVARRIRRGSVPMPDARR